jgi:alpha/beta superfamily hydrolase
VNGAGRDLTLHTSDGLALQAELADTPTADRVAAAAVVLCHPHPQFGGTMQSIVISALFAALPGLGYPCLRFNFRGVERSTGVHAEGRDEPLDVIAGIDTIASERPDLPIVVVGWSFGADMALSITDARLAGWVAIAAPLHYRAAFDAATDPRPKHLVLAEHDEFREPADIRQAVAGWDNTTSVIVPGASHFFVGRTDRVVTETRTGIDRALP